MDISLAPVISQNLLLTYKMQQHLKVLQMSNLELRENIYSELEQNPILELVSDGAPFEPLDRYYEKYDYRSNSDEYYEPFNSVAQIKTLKDHLYEQIGYLKENPTIILIMEHIVECLDENGFFVMDIPYLCEELNVSKREAMYALRKMRGLSPVGIASGSLKECLKHQLRLRGVCDCNTCRIIDDYFELVALGRFKRIADELKIKPADVKKHVEIIKSLNPIPSRGYASDKYNNYAIPEAIIERHKDCLTITMNDGFIPTVKVSGLHRELIRSARSDEDRVYLKKKLNSATCLVSAVKERQRTMYTIIEKITELQSAYFLKSEKYLKPMTLKEIAHMLDVHESTISRGIKDKFITTPYKTCLIKDLFTTGVGGGENRHSSPVIKNEIMRIIKEENSQKPLSDYEISNTLSRMGIMVSRRTVAKYRLSLGILPSHMR